jgi:spermidine synthase
MSKPSASKLREFQSPWFFESGIIRTFPCDGLSRADILLQIYRDEASRPYILETTRDRRLQFTCGATQSVMSLEDPDALVTAYARKMMAFLLFNPNPKHIVMIGLGGGSLPKFCYRHLPRSLITVVEINEDVIALREEFCIPKDDDRFRVVHDDGARFVEHLAEPIDALLIDAFDAEGIAPSLAKASFYECAARQLTDNGLTADQLTLTDDAVREVITSYTREAGVRQLERELGRLARKVTRRIAAREVEHVKLDRDDVRPLLGRPRVRPEKANREDEVGIATGMYYTPAGGDIMFVEAAPMRGKGDLRKPERF